MDEKIKTLFDYIKNLCESDLNRIINFVLDIISVSQQPANRPDCPYCRGSHVIKYGHKVIYTTNTLMAGSQYGRPVWADFIRDTLYGRALDDSAEKLGFSHQMAFNMRHKFLMARKHGAKAAKRGISKEYVAICTGIQRDGGIVAETVNRAKPSAKELEEVFRGHIGKDTLILTDGLRSYNVLETLADCTVVDINCEEYRKMFHLNTVNSLHSYIKETYNHYQGVATQYINRYNALFSIAFRCADSLKDTLFAALCNIGQNCCWYSV